MKKRILLLLMVLLILTGCARYGLKRTANRDIFAMDTVMNLTCTGENTEEALDAAEVEIRRLDKLLSTGRQDSEITILNHTGSGVLSSDSMAMVQKALEIYETTDGAFDITVYPLMELWDFTDGEFKVPAPDELAEALELTGSDKVDYSPKTGRIVLSDGQGIDLGGIAKGYASDRLKEIFREYGVENGTISLGGNVQFYGKKADGTPWRCAIKNPFRPNENNYLGIVETDDRAVVTSGAYERYFTEDGKKYHHILDPKTGYSADNGLVSVTIVSKSGILADALSTACYVMGLDRSVDFWRQYGADFDMVLMTEDSQVYITPGISEGFTSDFPVNVIGEK
ncbi:MAG: FAD:protein FMN transferase [Oscillospiraceae bacterium]|nr:FAD:protein FMN transferase [Oscillospiraceae bacterium]